MALSRFSQSTFNLSKRSQQTTDALAGLTPLPYTPTIGTATDGGTGTTVSVAFTPNATAPAGTYYTALSSPGSISASSTSSPITVSGLTAGTAYTFQVAAVNATGSSAYSSASNSVTPVVPTSFYSIASATGTGSSGVITFSSIPSGYSHLQIRMFTLNASATYNYLQFNGDTGSNYSYHQIYGDGSSVSAQGGASNSVIYIQQLPSSTTYPTVAIVDILDYANTNKYKTVRSLSGVDTNGGGYIYYRSGSWQNTAAVTSLTFTASAGSYTTSSVFALYGVK
jgi:hypothetical protein